LEGIDQFQEIVEADDPFELESGAILDSPDEVGFDPADNRQSYHHAFSPRERLIAVDHETLRGNVGDLQEEIAALAMLRHHRKINRMTRRAALIGNGKLCT